MRWDSKAFADDVLELWTLVELALVSLAVHRYALDPTTTVKALIGQNMKFTKAVLLLISLNGASAFMSSSRTPSATRLSLSEVDTTDLTIPYDAAARLAYDEWREEFGKGAFDVKRFQNFKSNYEAITVANVKAKKKARDEGKEVGPLMTLNEYGDLTEAEFKASSGEKPMTTGDVLGKAMEAAQSQSEASVALEEAANALAEEEEALAKKLGLNSVEELEIALDSLEGIADDGGELDQENLAREARIRSAYIQWCKDFNKEQDEKRFESFSNNFLTMEKLSQETGKDMQLNEYADFSEQEFVELQKASKKKSEPKASTGPSAVEKAKAAFSNFTPPKIDLPKIQIDETPESPEAKQAREEAAKAAQARREEQAKREAERRKEVEKEKADRQKAQEQEINKLNESLESAAIRAAKEAAEMEAKRAAKQRELDELAAKAAREKAEAWEKKQQQLQKTTPSKVETKKSTGIDISSIFPSPSPAPKPAPSPVPAKAPVQAAKKTVDKPRKKALPDIGSFFKSSPAPALSKVPAPAPASMPAPAASTKKTEKKAAPSFDLTSIFAGKSEAPAKAAPTKATPVEKSSDATKKSAPAFDFGSMFKAPSKAPAAAPITDGEVDVADPVTDAFNSFFGIKEKKEAPVAKKPEPAKAAGRPSLSIFGSTKSKAPSPAPAPVKETPPKSSPFSLFGAQTSSGTTSVSKKEVPRKKAPVKVPNRSGTISIFGSGPKKEKADVSPPKVSTSKAPPTPSRPTLSIFGATKKEEAPAQQTTPKKAASPSFSFFGGKTQAAESDVDPSVPVLTRWNQNPDGSITGRISNSKNFRNGTEITTSPVKRGAKAGTVVKTGSGSKYFLK